MKIHFIGIAGIGVSGLAKICLERGDQVSGSDLCENIYSNYLKSQGATIYSQHHAENAAGADLIVYTSAVNEQNPEYAYALENKIKMLSRSEFLASLSREKKKLVAIAGSHGKTTTSSLTTYLLNELVEPISYVVGGKILNYQSQASYQEGEIIVIEADESDGSLLNYHPEILAITNIDFDHPDHFKSLSQVIHLFEQAILNIKTNGQVILNLDDEISSKMVNYIKNYRDDVKIFTIGSSEKCDLQLLSFDRFGFEVNWKQQVLRIPLFKPGKFNCYNIMLAMGAKLLLQSELKEQELECLNNFQGISRRMEFIGELEVEQNKIRIYDDYAHHPFEINSLFDSLKDDFNLDETLFIIEPHRKSRLAALWDDYKICLKALPNFWLTPVYAAHENNQVEISSQKILQEIEREDCFMDFDQLQSLSSISELNRFKNVVLCNAGRLSSLIRDQLDES